MGPSTINFPAVLAAAVAYMILGALWYSPALFGNAWMRGIGKTKEQVAADFSPLNYVWAIVTAFFAAYGIARIMSWTGGGTIGDGIKVSLLLGICLIAAALWMNDKFEARPVALSLINVTYHLCGLVVVGIIIGAWQ
jgi:hypothetical protein